MITSSSNRQMKQITALLKKSKERSIAGSFVVEGKKMLAEAPAGWIKHIYAAESFLKEQEAEKLLAKAEYEIVADHVFQSVSDTKTPQGILAVVETPKYGRADLICSRHTRLLVLENIQDPGNLGTMIRTGEGAGIDGVIINSTSVDLFAPKTIRSTMGSIYRVPCYITKDLGETIRDLKGENITVYAAALNGSILYDSCDYTKSGTAFLIGNEGRGLSEEIIALADRSVKIPMEGNVESLNAAVSAALLMYEANRQLRRGFGREK